MGAGTVLKQVEKAGRTTSQINNLIDEWIFSKKSRRILKMKLLDDETYEVIAEETGMSVDQIKRIVKKGVATLKCHL